MTVQNLIIKISRLLFYWPFRIFIYYHRVPVNPFLNQQIPYSSLSYEIKSTQCVKIEMIREGSPFLNRLMEFFQRLKFKYNGFKVSYLTLLHEEKTPFLPVTVSISNQVKSCKQEHPRLPLRQSSRSTEVNHSDFNGILQYPQVTNYRIGFQPFQLPSRYQTLLVSYSNLLLQGWIINSISTYFYFFFGNTHLLLVPRYLVLFFSQIFVRLLFVLSLICPQNQTSPSTGNRLQYSNKSTRVQSSDEGFQWTKISQRLLEQTPRYNCILPEG